MLSSIPTRSAAAVGQIPAGCLLAESPVWQAGDPGRLLWVDCERQTLHWRGGGVHGSTVLPVPDPLVAVCERDEGGLVVLAGRGIYALGDPRAAPVLVAEIPDEPAGIRFNDAKPGPQGRLWAGTVRRGQDGAGALWSYRPDEGLVRHWTGITHGNGIGWDAAGRLMYVVDSGAGTMRRAEVDPATGLPGKPAEILRLTHEDGLPDGLAVDRDGCVWLAVWGGSCVLRLAPGGAILDRLDVPARNPTSCAFTGPDLAVLAVTTAADDVDRQAPGGDVHLFRVGATGVEVGRLEWSVTATDRSECGSRTGGAVG